MELVTEESRLQSDIRNSKKRTEFIEPYFNFFELLSILWNKIDEGSAKKYFKDMVFTLFEEKHMREYIIERRKKSENAYEEIENLYIKLGGDKKWKKKK